MVEITPYVPEVKYDVEASNVRQELKEVFETMAIRCGPKLFVLFIVLWLNACGPTDIDTVEIIEPLPTEFELPSLLLSELTINPGPTNLNADRLQKLGMCSDFQKHFDSESFTCLEDADPSYNCFGYVLGELYGPQYKGFVEDHRIRDFFMNPNEFTEIGIYSFEEFEKVNLENRDVLLFTSSADFMDGKPMSIEHAALVTDPTNSEAISKFDVLGKYQHPISATRIIYPSLNRIWVLREK